MKYKSIYVAATSQHVGKTTSTLGLVHAFRNLGIDIGYCKPVGQQYVIHQNLQVDKDVVLFADLLGFVIKPELHSPVILGSGATSAFIEHPEQFEHEVRLKSAARNLKKQHDLLLFEGTGHPGVGSVVNLSNADVAKIVGAGVVMVAEGGIGSTIDMTNLCLSLFKAKKVPILGVILNKVQPDKMEKVGHYVGKKLDQMGIPFLGMMPYDRTMSLPLIRTVAESVDGDFEYFENKNGNQVRDIIAGSLISYEELKGKNSELLLVVGAARLDIAIESILELSKAHKLEKCPFSGIISTGIGTYNKQTIDYINRYEIPVMRTHLETYGAVIKVSRIEVKINQQTPWKVKRAIEMIEGNINLNRILEQCL
jgi:dethiobiotin synthetase